MSYAQNQGTLAGDSIVNIGYIATSTYFAPDSTSGSNSGHCFAFLVPKRVTHVVGRVLFDLTLASGLGILTSHIVGT